MSDVESAHVFGRQVEANRYIERVVAEMIGAEVRERGESAEGWFYGGVTHEPTRRRITKAARALAVRLAKSGRRGIDIRK